MVYLMELRFSFSQQLAKWLRGGGHQPTDLYVSVDLLGFLGLQAGLSIV